MRNPNGYGGVIKLSGNRRRPYVARITSGFTAEGKQLYTNIGYYVTLKDAKKALAQYNDSPYDIEMSKTTFSEIYDRWFSDTFNEDSNRSTVKNYTSAFRHCSDLYDMRMTDIRPNHMQKIMDDFSDNYQTAKRIQTLLNQLYKWCLEHDCLTKNYAEHLKINAKYDPKPRTPFSTAEIQSFWAVSDDTNVMIVLMLIYSGLRINELLELKKEDVHIDEQWFKVRASKTYAGIRVVPIADKVLPFWNYYLNFSKCDYVICTSTGSQMLYDNYKRHYWLPLMKQLGMAHTPHETRHTFISQMVMKKADQTILKKIVGHKSIMSLTENVYTHIEVKELLDEVNKI